jgi:hypothetical protein
MPNLREEFLGNIPLLDFYLFDFVEPPAYEAARAKSSLAVPCKSFSSLFPCASTDEPYL